MNRICCCFQKNKYIDNHKVFPESTKKGNLFNHINKNIETPDNLGSFSHRIVSNNISSKQSLDDDQSEKVNFCIQDSIIAMKGRTKILRNELIEEKKDIEKGYLD